MGDVADRTSVFTGPCSIVSIADADPDIAAQLPADETATLRLATRATVVHLGKGEWDPPVPGPGDLGQLILSGLLARIVRIGRRESLELLGPGDVIRAGEEGEQSLVECHVHWEVLERSAVAVLDARFARAVGRWPQLPAALIARAVRRSKWLAVQGAIDSHPTIEERLMLIFGHLGERMGRICPDGVAVDLPLSHRSLAQAVRALRPSVSAGLSRLRQDGRLKHPCRQRWVVTHAGLEYVSELCGHEVIDC